jgi:arabinan endo-1,5-alpha-L-arabinosidase
MKFRILAVAVTSLLAGTVRCPAAALDGEPYIHDPSTLAFCDGKYYTFGTGSGGLISADGWTWRSGGVRPGGGAAPDVMKIGERYLVVYGVTGGGLGGGHNGRIVTMWNKTLDPQSPDFMYTQAVEVASTDGIEDCDAIDPSLLLDPNDGRLWLSYGTFFGFIRLVELDPKTGRRVEGNQPINIGIDMEATALVYRDGWYYLFGDHGTCCNGATSTYNIVVGRSKKVTGPYVDNMGQPVLKGGGKMVVAASGRFIGAGHFGRTVLGDGVEKFSCHYEADLDRSGRSVLDIRPLLWKDGWPVAGDNIQKETMFRISAVGGGMLQPGGGGGGGADYMIAPVAGVGGYLGMPFVKITLAETTKVLAVNANRELTTAAAFTSAPEQLWRVDQLVDGSWRIMPKDAKEELALMANGAGVTTLSKFDFKNDRQRWKLTVPGESAVLKEGTYQIQSQRSGFALELAVDGTPIPGRGGFGGRGATGPVTPVAIPDLAQSSRNWPAGNIDLRLGDFMIGAHQKWTVAPVANAGGTAEAPFYKITIAGTERALAATAERELVAVPTFSGKAEELWRIEALGDGTYRITPKAVPGSAEVLVLTAVGGSAPSLTKFDAKSDKCRWNFKMP